MDIRALLALEACFGLTIIAGHEFRIGVRPRIIDLLLREEFAAWLVGTPGWISDAIFGLLLGVAQGDGVVQVVDDGVEFDWLGATHRRKGTTVGHSCSEACVETLSAEYVTAFEEDRSSNHEVIVAPMAL